MQIRERLLELRNTARGRSILRTGQTMFTAGIILLLIWQLRDVQFRDVFQGMPRNPWFYVLLVLLYFLLPAVQFLAYRSVWEFRTVPAIRAFIKKRILNKDVLGYSGEVYIFTWAQAHVDLPTRSLWECVRDMNIISAAASTLMAILLLGLFALEGQVSVRDLLGGTRAVALVGGIGVTVILLLVVLKWRKWIFSMPWKATRIVFGLHLGLVLSRQIMEISMWHLAMPEVPIGTWFTYAAVSIIVSRIPFIPNQDLLTMALAVSIAEAMTVSEAHIAALFLAVAVVNRLINLLFFATLSIRMPNRIETESIPDTSSECASR